MLNYHLYRKYLSSSQPRSSFSVSGCLYAVLLLLFLFRGHLRSSPQTSSGDGGDFTSIDFDDGSGTEDLDQADVAIIEAAFRKADIDGSKDLSLSELEHEINRQTRDHIMKAIRNNFKNFFSLDNNKKDGQIAWSEYYNYFVRGYLGLEEGLVNQLNSDPKSMPRSVQESVARLKAAWSEVAKSNPDALNIDELLALEHPESSMSLLMAELETLLNKYDLNDDGKLTLEEFSSDSFRELSPGEIKERQEEFAAALDTDKNGLADRKELIKYLDPKNTWWSRVEARRLIKAADKDSDNHLNLKEILLVPYLFLDSKLIDPNHAFHPDL